LLEVGRQALEQTQQTLPQKKESLFDEGFLIIITGLGNVFNFYFHIFMSRNLGPEGYSALNSLLSLLYIISIPIVTIQTTITKFVAQYSAVGESGKVRRLLLECLKRVGVAAFVLMALTILGAPYIGRFFNIRTTGPIIVAGLLLFFTYLMPVFWAVLQGREQFKYLGISYFVGFSAKCGLGILFAVIGWGVGGVLFGVLLSFVLAFIVGFPAIRTVLARVTNGSSLNMGEMYRFALPVVTALFFLSFFCNLDIALVRHFYGDVGEGLKLAGYYATASIVGKAFLFLPLGITLALFPKVSRKKATGENPLPMLKRGLLIEIVLSTTGILMCLLLARFVALVLGKTDAPELVALIRMFGIAITPIAATTILVNYDLANERYGFIWLLLPLTVLTFAAIWFFHPTPMSVLLAITAGGLALFISISIFTFLPVKVNKPAPQVVSAS
jgi:O-antigen/teichoic acid export membrane protein